MLIIENLRLVELFLYGLYNFKILNIFIKLKVENIIDDRTLAIPRCLFEFVCNTDDSNEHLKIDIQI